MANMQGPARITTPSLAIVLTFALCASGMAQRPNVVENPLRIAKPGPPMQSAPARFESDPNAKPLKRAADMSALLEPLESATHSIVHLTGGTAEPKAASLSQDNPDTSASRRDPGFLQAAYNEQISAPPQNLELQKKPKRNLIDLPFDVQPLPSDENMFGMVGNIAINCLFVLSIGIAFILVARRGSSLKSKQAGEDESVDELRVQQVLKIDSKKYTASCPVAEQ